MDTDLSTTGPNPEVAAHRHVVVGVEVAEPSSGATRWACAEAARRHLPLQLVTACPALVTAASGLPGGYVGDSIVETTRTALERLADRFRAEVEVLPVHVSTGSPRHVLLDATAEDAELLVVGRRGIGAAQHALVGSTSIAVAGRSPIPVVVVPDGWVPADHATAPIVVGVSLGEDESGNDTADPGVLRFAFDRARALGVPIVAVHAWEVPVLASWSPVDIEASRRRSQTHLESLLAPWRAEYADVEVESRAVAERASDAVRDASRVAQLAVVGRHTPATRHRGLRLGSTARAVLHHAEIPVGIIPVAGQDAPGHSPSHAEGDVWGPMY